MQKFLPSCHSCRSSSSSCLSLFLLFPMLHPQKMHIPQAVASHNGCTVRRNRTTIQLSLRDKGHEQVTSAQIPDLQSLVPGSRHHLPSVWRHRHRCDPTRVPSESALFHAATKLPHFQGFVIGGRHDLRTIRCQRYRSDHLPVPGDGSQ